MPVRIADELKQTNDLETFPVARASAIWIDRNKGKEDPDWVDMQKLFNEGGMGGALPEISGPLGEVFDLIYPIGSIYISIGGVKPIYGEWERLASGRTLWNDDTADGREIEAGLPNITGEIGNIMRWEATASGAFSVSGSRAGSWSNQNGTFMSRYALNASRSSAIYGKSSTVQPPSIAVSMWRRVA